jgi:hypothetical protein
MVRWLASSSRTSLPSKSMRQQHVVLAEADRHPLDQRLVHHVRADARADRQVELAAQRLEHLVGAHQPLGDEQVRQAPAALGLALAGLGQLLLGEARRLEQDPAQVEALEGRAGRRGRGLAHGCSGGWIRIEGASPWERSITCMAASACFRLS